MTIPRVVQKQKEESDRAMAEAQAKLNGETAPAAATTKPATPPATPPEPPEATPPATPPAVSGQEALQKEYQTLKARYSTLQGKYEAEVPRLNDALKQVQSQLAELEKRPVVPAAPEVPAYMRRLSKEDREGYDQKSLQVQGDVATGVAEDLLAREREKVQRELADLRNRQDRIDALASQGQRKAATLEMLQGVEPLSSGAVEIETNAANNGFDQFLDTVDTLSGRTYRVLAGSAMENNDLRRIAGIFEEFKTATGWKPSGSDVASQAKPTRTRASTPPKPVEKRRIPASEFTAFCNDKALNRLRCTPDEAKALEAEYNEAISEGRIDPNK